MKPFEMKTLFGVYVGNYELPSGVVLDQVGDLEWTINKMFTYGVSKENVLKFVYENWSDPQNAIEWHFSDSDPFSVTVWVHRSLEPTDPDSIDDETLELITYKLHNEVEA